MQDMSTQIGERKGGGVRITRLEQVVLADEAARVTCSRT